MRLRLRLAISDGGALNPAVLFTNGEEGAWYDPSDISTLWQDSARTTPVTDYGDAVGAIDDKSGNGNHATQATAAARPIYGRVPATGRRNLQTYSQANDNWAAQGTTPPTVNNNVTYLGETCASVTIDETMTSGFSGTRARHAVSVAITNGTTYITSFNLSMSRALIGGESFIVYYTGSWGLGQAKITSANCGPYVGAFARVITPDITSGADGVVSLFVVSDSGVTSPVTVYINRAQIEVGSSATDYQRVGNEYDVTEDGVRSLAYLFDDGVDDALNATLPDLGTDATVAYASDQGVTIQTGQTIGAGAFDVLRDDMLFGMVVIDRALTTAETARLTAWLNHRAGDYA